MVNLAGTFLLALARWRKRGGIIVNEHTLSRAETEFHVQTLRRWFDLISLAELPQRLARPTRRPFCLLTFDDGKRSNATEAAPELQRLGVPAVFYVTTDPLTTGSCLWFDGRQQLVEAIGYCPAGLELNTLKQLPLAVLLERLERARKVHQFKPGDAHDDLRPMSWEDARNLHQRGFVIGAHGVTHAILTRETRKRAFTEIEESMAAVSLELGAPCRTFAFPNGNYNQSLTEHARRCGATSIMTTEPTWVDERTPLHQLPRVQLFAGASRGRIETKIALAAFRGALVNPNGSGRNYSARPAGATAFSPNMPVPGASSYPPGGLRPSN